MSLPPPLFRTPLNAASRERDDEQSQKSGSGRYRTLCVRACDGYYFPISNATTRSGFYKDAKICKASCGEDAKLFYHDKNDTSVSDMVDLTGRPYVRHQTAFLYRKRQVEGCKCKPDPWELSELQRHRGYASADYPQVDAVRKQALGPSDPAVRTAFERQEQQAAASVEAGSGITALTDRRAATNDDATDGGETAATDAAQAAEPTPESDETQPKPEPKAGPKPRKPSLTGAEHRSPRATAPTRASIGPTAVPRTAAQPAFGLGGSKLRWPGE